jgi:hypothetical protein
VVISASGSAPLIIDREIERQGIKRRIALQIPNCVVHADEEACIPIEPHQYLLERRPRREGLRQQLVS